MTLSAFGVDDSVSKALGGSNAPWNETRIKRDKGGRFSTVEARGAKAAATVNRSVHQGAAATADRMYGAGLYTTAEAVEDHPYVTLVVAGVAARVGGRKAMDAYAKGRLIRGAAKVEPSSRLSHQYKPTRSYSVADQAEGMQDVVGYLNANPTDWARMVARGVQQKATGRTPLPKVKYDEQGRVKGANAHARMFGANRPMIDDLFESTTSGGRPYSQNSLRMMQGNSAEDTLRTVEKRIKGNNHESAFVVVEGELVSGMNGTWMMTGYAIPKDTKIVGRTVNFTHNHPTIVKSQARSFSPGDFNVLTSIIKNGASKKSTLRAVYGDGTVQEIVITDWAKFKRFNRIMQDSILGLAAKEKIDTTALSELLTAQAQIQEAANSGKYGFKIMEYKDFAKASRLMSDAEIRRRKKAQGVISQTTGALGLTALGITGAKSKTGQRLIRRGFETTGHKPPKMLKKKKLNAANTAVLSTGAGIGGAGSFNFAAYTNAESRKRNMNRPKKTTVAKIGEWKTIDQRERTQRRDRKVQTAAGGAIGAGAGLGVLGYNEGDRARYRAGGRAITELTNLKQRGEMSSQDYLKGTRRAVKMTGKSLSGKGKAGLALVGAGAAVGGGAKGHQTYQQHKINQRRRSNFKKAWQPTATTFDAERRRHRRNEAYPYAAAAAGGAGAALRGGRAIGLHEEAKRVQAKKKKGTAAQARNLRGLRNRAGKQAVGIAAGGALAAAALERKRKTDSWASYAKSASTSAFGVTH